MDIVCFWDGSFYDKDVDSFIFDRFLHAAERVFSQRTGGRGEATVRGEREHANVHMLCKQRASEWPAAAFCLEDDGIEHKSECLCDVVCEHGFDMQFEVFLGVNFADVHHREILRGLALGLLQPLVVLLRQVQ